MAHGQDVANAVRSAPLRRLTGIVARRAHTVIFNSAYLRDQMPVPVRRSEVIDLGIDLDAFQHRDAAPARATLGLADTAEPIFLFAGSLIERKNIVRLRDAFAALGRGTLVVLGDGPLRPELEGRAASGSPAASPMTPSATGSPPATPSSSRRSSSRSARSCSRRWRASAASSRRTSAARRSS